MRQSGLTPLFWSHVRPYGEVNLDMGARLDLAVASVPGPRAPANHGAIHHGERMNPRLYSAAGGLPRPVPGATVLASPAWWRLPDDDREAHLVARAGPDRGRFRPGPLDLVSKC